MFHNKFININQGWIEYVKQSGDCSSKLTTVRTI